MILAKPSVRILRIISDPLGLIEEAGRTCYKSEDKITENSKLQFAKMIQTRNHQSVIEHSFMTARFICDRGVSHEIVRHRLASYSQESTRYCDYNKGHCTFIIPPWCDLVKPGLYDNYDAVDDDAQNDWLNVMFNCEDLYKHLRTLGWKPEQARSVLPNSLKTEIVMSANFREWHHFFSLRTAKTAHPQMREVAIPLLLETKAFIPVIFDDILVEE